MQKTETVKKLLGGKVRLERRNSNPMVYARTYLQGKQLVYRTGEVFIANAERIAEDWFMSLHDRVRRGEPVRGILFSDMAPKFIANAERQKQVSPLQLRNYRHKWNLLKPHFENVTLTDIDTRWLERFRDTRAQAVTSRDTPIKPTTIKKDLVFISLVLKYAKDYEKVLDELPQFPSFRGTWAIVSQGRPYFNADDYKTLVRTAWTRQREDGLNERTRRQRRELYLMIHIMTGAALRVGEAQSLRWQDCKIGILSDGKKFSVLYLDVLGKHSRGGEREPAYGTSLALAAYYRMKEGKPDGRVFTETHRDGFRELLDACGLRTDAKGRTRDLKSLRPTGMSQRLEATANPDYRDIAKWARTSPAMIATFYDQTHPEQSVTRLMKRKRR